LSLPLIPSIRGSSRYIQVSRFLRTFSPSWDANGHWGRLQGFQPSVESTSPRRCFHLRSACGFLGFHILQGTWSSWDFPGLPGRSLAVASRVLRACPFDSSGSSLGATRTSASGHLWGCPLLRRVVMTPHAVPSRIVSGTSGFFHQISKDSRKAPFRRYRHCGDLPCSFVPGHERFGSAPRLGGEDLSRPGRSPFPGLVSRLSGASPTLRWQYPPAAIRTHHGVGSRLDPPWVCVSLLDSVPCVCVDSSSGPPRLPEITAAGFAGTRLDRHGLFTRSVGSPLGLRGAGSSRSGDPFRVSIPPSPGRARIHRGLGWDRPPCRISSGLQRTLREAFSEGHP